MIKLKNIVNEMKVNKNDYSVDFTPEINDIQKSLNDTISKFKDLGKKLDTKATSVFPNYPKDAIHRRKPDTIDGQVFANTIKEFKVEPMIDWLEGNNKYWSALKFSLSKAEKAYPTTNRGKPLELDK